MQYHNTVMKSYKLHVSLCDEGLARSKWFAYGPADANGIPSSLASLKSRLVQPF